MFLLSSLCMLTSTTGLFRSVVVILYDIRNDKLRHAVRHHELRHVDATVAVIVENRPHRV